MQNPIAELAKLGQMPDSLAGDPSSEIVGRYDDLLSKVKTALTQEEVKVLISIFPKETMYEVEWSLLHLVETYSGADYRELISECPSEEWRDTMIHRLDS